MKVLFIDLTGEQEVPAVASAATGIAASTVNRDTGAVTLHPVGSEEADQTKPAGTVGLGVNYTIPGTGFGILVEGRGWVYELSDVGGFASTYDRTQFDVAWSAGFTYVLPIGSAVRSAN